MKNKIFGVLLAVAFGLVATIPWIILGYLGWIASIAGYLIGLAAYTGYTKGNGSFDKLGKITIALVILFIVPGAELINVFLTAMKEGFTFVESLTITPFYFIEYFGDFIPSISIGYFMAVLGTYKFFIPEKKIEMVVK